MQNPKRTKTLLVVNGHPDPSPHRFCAAIARASVNGAAQRGWNATQFDVANFCRSATSSDVLDALDLIKRAALLIVVFPLWLDAVPDPLRAFFDEVADARSGTAGTALEKSAHLIVTMALPAFAARARARSETATGRSPGFGIPGVHAERQTYIGNADSMTDSQRRSWLERIEDTAVVERSLWRKLSGTARHVGQLAAH